MLKSRAYKLLINFIEKLTKANSLKEAEAKRVEAIIKQFRKEAEVDISRLLKNISTPLKRSFKKIYTDYINSGYKRFMGDNITKKVITEAKPYLKKQLDDSIINSLGYIKTQSEDFLNRLEGRFRSYTTIPSVEMRGDDYQQALKKFKEYVDISDIQNPDAWQKFIIKDQTRKFLGNMNRIVAQKSGAVAGIWNNRGDKRVVGNPSGLYPKGTAGHENHWKREGKIYLLKDSWAVKKGYVELPKGEIYAEDISDGMPSVAYGCRCWFAYIINLDKLPAEFLTEKGKRYLETE